jgi:putative hydrolase of the HAD superfamily
MTRRAAPDAAPDRTGPDRAGPDRAGPDRTGPDRVGPADPPGGLDHVETWVFDLDNTLYPASCNLFDQVSRRMGSFIQETFGLDPEAARAKQKQYFHDHGTTLRGLMTVDGIDPAAFLAYVHDIDVSVLPPMPQLEAALAALPGRKVVFTNGSVPHAERVMTRLGIERHFEAIWDIVASDYVPKPDPAPYARMIERHGIAPDRAAMVEDMAKNLRPAHDLGMTTVWVRTELAWALPDGEDAHVHHVVDDLTDWLAGVGGGRG